MATQKKKASTKAKAAPKATPTEKAAPVAADSSRGTQASVRREMIGTVVSDKMQKTIVVRVDRRVKHGLYRKFITRSEKYKAHDEKNDAKIGDQVVLRESRPLSRDKRWVLTKILRRSAQTADANV